MIMRDMNMWSEERGGYLKAAPVEFAVVMEGAKRNFLRFGIGMKNADGRDGVLVTSIQPRSPATQMVNVRTGKTFRMALQRDVITEINGHAIDNFKTAIREILRSPQKVEVRILDPVANTHDYYRLTLRK